MRMRLYKISVMTAVMAVGAALPARSADTAEPRPDPRTMRFVQRAIAWYPDSAFRLVENTQHETAQGAYRYVSVARDCASTMLSEQPSAIIDEGADSIWLGAVGELPSESLGMNQSALKNFVSGFLPDALFASMNLRVKVEWDATPRRPSAVLPLNLLVDTGYGTVRRPAGVTADGRYLVMGVETSLKEDPVAARRRQLASSPLVVWDRGGGAGAAVEIVEFSDLECPACKSKWPLIEKVIEANGSAVRHGMVSYPLTMIHPWAFRAASASWCVADQEPALLIPFKEVFYSLQRDMEVSEVTPTSVDFVAGRGLDEDRFMSCYLREPSITAVHGQLALGNRLGVRATPTYFVNGWMVQLPNESWFPDMVKRLAAGEEP